MWFAFFECVLLFFNFLPHSLACLLSIALSTALIGSGFVAFHGYFVISLNYEMKFNQFEFTTMSLRSNCCKHEVAGKKLGKITNKAMTTWCFMPFHNCLSRVSLKVTEPLDSVSFNFYSIFKWHIYIEFVALPIKDLLGKCHGVGQQQLKYSIIN